MGKVLIIIVLLITAIFAAITLSVQHRAEKAPEMLSRGNIYDLNNVGAYALRHAIKQIKAGSITSDTTTSFDDFIVLTDGRINSIKYDFEYDYNDDYPEAIDIIANVSWITPDDTLHHECEAVVSCSGGGAFNYAILSNEDMTFTGSGTIDIGNGLVHTNGNFKMTGSGVLRGNLSSSVRIWCTGSTVIDGDATTPVWKGKSPGNVTDTVTTAAVDHVEIPDIDLTPYYNEALANGQVYDGDQHFSGSGTIEPVGGIMWVNGNLKISGSGNMIGCFIATGYINISGSGDQIKVGDYPALVSRDSYIDISGSGKFHGLLYAKNGDFYKSGSGDVVGSIICGGEFKKSGSWSIMTYEDSTPIPPGGAGELTILYWRE